MNDNNNPKNSTSSNEPPEDGYATLGNYYKPDRSRVNEYDTLGPKPTQDGNPSTKEEDVYSTAEDEGVYSTVKDEDVYSTAKEEGVYSTARDEDVYSTAKESELLEDGYARVGDYNADPSRVADTDKKNDGYATLGNYYKPDPSKVNEYDTLGLKPSQAGNPSTKEEDVYSTAKESELLEDGYARVGDYNADPSRMADTDNDTLGPGAKKEADVYTTVNIGQKNQKVGKIEEEPSSPPKIPERLYNPSEAEGTSKSDEHKLPQEPKEKIKSGKLTAQSGMQSKVENKEYKPPLPARGPKEKIKSEELTAQSDLQSKVLQTASLSGENLSVAGNKINKTPLEKVKNLFKKFTKTIKDFVAKVIEETKISHKEHRKKQPLGNDEKEVVIDNIIYDSYASLANRDLGSKQQSDGAKKEQYAPVISELSNKLGTAAGTNQQHNNAGASYMDDTYETIDNVTKNAEVIAAKLKDTDVKIHDAKNEPNPPISKDTSATKSATRGM